MPAPLPLITKKYTLRLVNVTTQISTPSVIFWSGYLMATLTPTRFPCVSTARGLCLKCNLLFPRFPISPGRSPFLIFQALRSWLLSLNLCFYSEVTSSCMYTLGLVFPHTECHYSFYLHIFVQESAGTRITPGSYSWTGPGDRQCASTSLVLLLSQHFTLCGNFLFNFRSLLVSRARPTSVQYSMMSLHWPNMW